MTRRQAAALAPAALLIGLLSCGRSRDYLRYRMTIEVDTPGGVVAGSSVLENRNSAGSGGIFRSIDHGSGEVYGEAPIVDLGNGRLLVAVLQDPYFRRRIFETALAMLSYPDLVPPLSQTYDRNEWVRKYAEAKRIKPKAVIRPADYPMLVSFADPMSPASVVEVSPDNLEAVFGAGYRLRRITGEVTDADVTRGIIEDRLPWLRSQHGALVKSAGAAAERSAAHRLNEGSFRRKDPS